MSRVELLMRSRLAMGAILVALAAALTGACGTEEQEQEKEQKSENTEVKIDENADKTEVKVEEQKKNEEK